MTLIPPSAEMLKIINHEMSQSQEITDRDLTLLREWLEKQPHLPSHIEDTRLERFLHGCKFSLERTKMILDRYYTVRANIPEFYAERDPMSEELTQCFDAMNYFILPGHTAEGYRVTICGLAGDNADNFNLQSLVKRIVMTLDARLLKEKCLNNIMVIDMKGFTLSNCLQVLPTNPIARKGMLCIQDAFPMRMAQLHFLNAPVFVDNIVKLFAPLLKPKLMQRFQFHIEGGEVLQKYMPKEILPVEYGGCAGTIQELDDGWRRELESLQSWFKEEERISVANEARRPKEKFANGCGEEHFVGVNGSFRQLSID